MKYEIIRCDNSDVTDFYLDIIAKSCEKMKRDGKYMITAQVGDTLKAAKRHENVIFWVQGIGPEESFMRNHSFLRLWYLSFREKKALNKADFLFFVSDYMREHFEHKYKISLPEYKYYVMPCFNTQINKDSFFVHGKYQNNIFTYIGSMSPWQGVDRILKLYKEIEQSGLSDCKLEIYTAEQVIAKNKIETIGIKNYSIGFCPNDDLGKVLGGVKFGFILREDNEVNRVSTPTKISTYLSHGIIPIYSDCLRSFHVIAQKMEYVINAEKISEQLNKFCEVRVNPERIYEEYCNVFSAYYSSQYHIDQITKKLDDLAVKKSSVGL